jgi:hypothetical protein
MAIPGLSNPVNDLKTSLDNVKSDVLGRVTSALNGTTKNAATSTPWNGVDSRFFKFITIKPERWDELYPYRIMVVDSKKGNTVVNGTSTANITVKGGNSNAIVNFEGIGQKWVFTLPISPQQLNITDQFAINTTATLRGILEEHSGVRFKLISAAGTMGVWPYRQSVSKPPSSPGILQSVFGGTIEGAVALVDQVKRVINTATTGHPAEKPAKKRPETSDQGPTSTGYYQALALQQFLEQYAEAKKDPKNAGWRLVFDIPKQNQSFVVTPMQFTWQQSVNKPLEIMYQLQFKAWRRVDLKQSISPTRPDIQSISPGILQRILNTISEARRTTSAAIDLIGAVRSDVTKPLDVLRQTSLFVKDLAGVAVTAADLPFQIQKDYASSIRESLSIIRNSLATTSSNPSVRSALSALGASAGITEGLSLAAVAGGQLGIQAAQAQSIDPANNIFNEPESNFDLMNEVSVFSMPLNNAQQAQVDDIIDDARGITVDDLRSFRNTIQELALQISNNFGAGDSYYSQIYNRPTPNTRIQPMTLDEFDILRTLYDVMQSYDILTATTEVDDLQKKTNMEYVAGLADLAGIPFELPTSKILVPVPFGLTIEAIAARYLGDPQRWIEIATLNNLRDPYIDENGFKLSLLSNATGRQITVSSTDNLYVGQRVVLGSSSQTQVARRILGIDRLSDTSFLITLDGEANLDNYVIADAAYLQAYLPGTVNSQQKIFIPSALEVSDDPNIIPPASVSSDPLVGLSKVDWLLTDSGDIAVNSFGDIRLSAGITNIIQALKIKFGTKKGTIITHPEFGLGLTPGVINSEFTAQDLFDEINKMLELDPRFQGLNSLQIEINGPVLSVNAGVNLAGQQGVFPLNFQVKT